MRGYSVSEDAVNALRAARDEATRLGGSYLSPELLLLGLLAADETLAARVLTNLGMTRELMMREVEQQIARLPGNEAIPGGRLPYTSSAKRALEGAMDEASELGDDHVHTEHLLLGILRDTASGTVRMLAEHQVTVDGVRSQLKRLRSSS